jgi:hypothetical protein
LGCSEDAPYIDINIEDSHTVDTELEGDGALNIHDDLHLLLHIYKQVVSIILTPKEWDCVVHKAKWFKCESNSFLWV